MNRKNGFNLLGVLALLVVLGAALAAAGCTSGSNGTATTPAPTAAGTAGVTAAGTAGPAGPAVGYDRLMPFLPKTAGPWTLDGEGEGMTLKDNEGRDYTFATGDYAKAGDEKAGGTIVITDNGMAVSPLKQQWSSFTQLDSTEMSIKRATADGQPAWRIEQKKANEHSMMVLAGDRFLVHVQVGDATPADLDALVDAIDFAGLAALK
ncbi:MAG: hypothetical protein AB7S61_04330 [Methanoregulaceae archaeon]